ncbi:YheC/YheD family protein [Paenibacillus sp. P26]|nr:YheC/YheD family protein [Paenibacillus sp. P26]UUZ90172.1 YheC/YheD family protein [Paenibacillus sp. P25]
MKRKYPSHIPNKWAKHKVLARNGTLSQYVPSTRLMNKTGLRAMLRKYGMVYVKPCFGLQGRGVIRMERKAGQQRKYRYQLGERIAAFAHFRKAYRSIKNRTQGKPYMVQKGIRLLTHGGRPFDIRLMVQKKPGGSWKVTGAVARVAPPRKIVTNGSQGESSTRWTVWLRSMRRPGDERSYTER